ncbi:tumor necrosis factor ligand superfamily member 9 [Engystomops pustulosus]
MSPTVRSEDPENLRSSHPSCRFLDYFLVISLVLLTMAMGSLLTLYVAWERPQFESNIKEQIQNDQKGRSAQLVVDNEMLTNGTLEWSETGVTNHFVDQYFKHDKKELVIKRSGFYFISSQITLSCVDTSHCQEKGLVSLSILKKYEEHPILTVNVHIEAVTVKPKPSSISGSIRYLASGDRIEAKLQTSHEIADWHFDKAHTVLGLIWISDTSSIEYHSQ